MSELSDEDYRYVLDKLEGAFVDIGIDSGRPEFILRVVDECIDNWAWGHERWYEFRTGMSKVIDRVSKRRHEEENY